MTMSESMFAPCPFAYGPRGKFTAHTFHIDVRFEMAFSQLGDIVQAIQLALKHGRRNHRAFR